MTIKKTIICFYFIFLFLNIFPITFIKCSKEQNICECTQISRLIKISKHSFKKVNLDEIKQAVYYRMKRSKNYGAFKYFGYGIGIELKIPKRHVFYAEEKGDFVISNYSMTKAKAEKFVNKFNEFLENKNENDFKDTYINPWLFVSFVLLGFIMFL